MHLLFLTEAFHPTCRGGAGRIAGDVAIELAQRGHKVDVISPVAGQRTAIFDVAPSLRVYGLPVANLDAGKRIDTPYSPRMLREAWSFIESNIDLAGVDLFHDNGGFFRDLLPLELRLLEALGTRPFIVQYQIQWRPLFEVERQDQSKLPPLIEQQRVLAQRADRILFLSRAELAEGQAAFAADPAKSLVVPNAIPTQRYAALADTPKPRNARPLISLAGRLSARSKGMDLALAALEELADDHDFDVRLIGHEISAHAVPAGLQGRITGTAWLDSDGVARALHASDLFVMPSRYEPFGILALEAQAVRTPVVALASGGLCDIIVHEETGLLADPADAVPSLVTQIERMLRSSSLREECVDHATQRLHEYYTVEVLCDRLEALYAGLV